MSGAIVFVGPTLSVESAREHLDAHYLPPVSQGDVYLAAKQRPLVIGIIDGYFDQVPAVWHKEILWAMSQGVHVVGAASMGALRAAELARFGMRGVGRVFEQFARSELEHDDEVAVAHGDAASGYRLASVAMVNIRATLARAISLGKISEPTRTGLVALARRRFYADRSYAALLSDARQASLSAAELGELEAWLPGGRIDQKREDAIALLQVTKSIVEAGQPMAPVEYVLSRTEAWHTAVQELSSRSGVEIRD